MLRRGQATGPRAALARATQWCRPDARQRLPRGQVGCCRAIHDQRTRPAAGARDGPQAGAARWRASRGSRDRHPLGVTGREAKRRRDSAGWGRVPGRLASSSVRTLWVASFFVCSSAPGRPPQRHLGVRCLPRARCVASPVVPDLEGPSTATALQPRDARLNSEKSITYGSNVEHGIIGAKPPGLADPRQRSRARRQAAPSVHYVRIDEDSAGQRLDNFLVKLLKGVPKTHVYRVIRSGEVRVNKGRAGADTRLDLGDEVRVPPVRTAQRRSRPHGAGARIPGGVRGRAPAGIDKPAGVAVHGGSGVSFGVIEQLRQRAARRRASWNWCTGSTRKPRACCCWPRSARALVALQDQFRAPRHRARPTLALVFGAWPAEQQGHRRGAAQVPRRRRRAARARGRRRARGRQALDHAGPRRARASRPSRCWT